MDNKQKIAAGGIPVMNFTQLTQAINGGAYSYSGHVYAITPNHDDPEDLFKFIDAPDGSFLLVQKEGYGGNAGYTAHLKQITEYEARVIEQGNYKKGHVTLEGVRYAAVLENERGYNRNLRYGPLLFRNIGQGEYQITLCREKVAISVLGLPVSPTEFVAGYDEKSEYRYMHEAPMIAYLGRIARLPVRKKRGEMFDRMLGELFATMPAAFRKTDGVSKLLKTVQPFYDKHSDIYGRMAFRTLVEVSNRVVENVKLSVALNKLFADVQTQEQFDKVLTPIGESLRRSMFEQSYFYDSKFFEEVFNSVPDARELKKAAIMKKATGAFNKVMDDVEFLKGLDQDKYPLTYAAVHEGELPIGVFFRKSGDSYFVYNDNWMLWELMLRDNKEVAIEIAAEAAKRTTYEKDVMSYFYFTLFALPEYLKRHTGKDWTGVPRMVNSTNELEPPKAGENGVAKTRSALTPIVDNESGAVVVPYVTLAEYGARGTTYCYGLDYNVLQRGFSFMGNVITDEVEKELNGRDDYGLMFYTLTGSAQGRGYPTFLIIFERLDEGETRVHFHRVHPMRSKDGDYNPVHNWITSGYRWMIGNVNFERIKAQQGDLAFVSIDGEIGSTVEHVDQYDSHHFERPVAYKPYEKKDNANVLGYIQLWEPTVLNHTEHRDRIIPPGYYEIRQCRSWEANPKGVWSMRYD